MNSYNDVTDFAAYIHNPYGFLNEKQKAAVLVFKRKGKFNEGYNINNNLRELLIKFFGNSIELVNNGLSKHYNNLKTYVENNNLIGLILYGADVNNVKSEEQFITTYITPKNTLITLQVSPICQILLKDYFKDDENYINALCEKTPNFEIYYSK